MASSELVTATVETTVILPEVLKNEVAAIEVFGLTVLTQRGIVSADEVPDWNDRLVVAKKLVKSLDDLRSELKAPHIARGKKVDADFNPMIARVRDLACRIESELLKWKRSEDSRIEAERERVRIENERIEAEALRKADDEKAKTAAALSEAAEAGFTKDEQKEWVGQAVAELPVVIVQIEAPPPKPENAVRSSYGSSAVTRRWSFEIENVNILPRAFLRIEPKAIETVEEWDFLRPLANDVGHIAGKMRPDEDAIKAAVAAGVRAISGVKIYQKESLSTR